MGVTVRPARAEDAPAAVNILRRSIALLCSADHRHDQADLASRLANKTVANVQAWIEADGNYCVVACLHGVMCGFSAMTSAGRITLCYVDPATRFAGVSSAMLAALEQEARRMGLVAMRLTPTLTARRFYLSRGYVPTEGEMEKRLHSK
jgi:GNAT superfamily N-acetyltransferase